MCMEEIQSFMKGLTSNRVLQNLKADVQGSIKLLTYSDDLINAHDMIRLLKPIYSEELKKHEKEEIIFANFIQLVEEIEADEDRDAMSLTSLNDIESGFDAPNIESNDITIRFAHVPYWPEIPNMRNSMKS